jgi:hypothetical protein
MIDWDKITPSSYGTTREEQRQQEREIARQQQEQLKALLESGQVYELAQGVIIVLERVVALSEYQLEGLTLLKALTRRERS